MKKLSLVLVLFLSTFAFGQRTHKVTLTWNHSTTRTTNPAITYNIYRTTIVNLVACNENATGYVKIANTGNNNYVDTVPEALYCYYVKAFDGTTESVPSNTSFVNAYSPTNVKTKVRP